MRRVLFAILLLVGCGGEDVGQSKQALVDPADYPLTLAEAEAQIAAHEGPGCLKLEPYVECRGCAPRYRLDAIAEGAPVGPCGKSTFVAGTTVKNADPKLGAVTWTCQSGPSGGRWMAEGATVMFGALVCR